MMLNMPCLVLFRELHAMLHSIPSNAAILCFAITTSASCASASVLVSFDGGFSEIGPGGSFDFHLDLTFGPGQAGDENVFNNGWNRIHLESITLTSGNYWANLFGGSIAQAALGVSVSNGDFSSALLAFAQGPHGGNADSFGSPGGPFLSGQFGYFEASNGQTYQLSASTQAALYNSSNLEGWSRPVALVPEPTTVAIWSLLGLFCAGVRWRRKAV